MLSPAQTTLIMQYIIGGLLAVIPLIVWGIIFYQKKKRKSPKKQVVISFFAGIFSVIPLFIVLGDMGDTVISFGNLQIHGLHIYNHLEALANAGGPMSLLTYIVVSMAVFFLIYIISGLITLILDITTGQGTFRSFEKTARKSLEEPMLFVTLGILIGVFAYFFRWNLHDVFWKSMMIGVVEEYAKHLLVRFVDEDKFLSVNDVIQFSILVALGFAFLENILYFVDKIWLSPCSPTEVVQQMCLYNEATGYYEHQVGILLAPFIFRSSFSTLAHVLFSGIFGYYYGLAHFASSEIKAAQKDKRYYPVIEFFHKLLHCKKEVVYHKQKMLEGAILAMAFHGFFDFVLDEQVASLYSSSIKAAPILLLVLPLIMGYTFISYQYTRPENQAIRITDD